MSCDRVYEIGLWVEGDLPAAESAALERHLSECRSCRDEVEAIRGSQRLLKDLSAESLQPAVYSAVRARVMARIQRPSRASRWRWAAAAAALACGLMLMMVLRRPSVPARPPAAARAAAVQPVTAPPRTAQPDLPHVPARAGTVHRARHGSPAPRPAAAAARQPLKIQLFTSDPEVVIYWIVDPKGD